MSYAEERKLVRRAISGDIDAFSHLYERYHARILATLIGRTRNRHDAEDLMQITFLRAYRGLSGFRGEAAFSTWLMQIALNVCTTHLRAKQARRSWQDTIESAHLGFRDRWEPAKTECPDDALNRKECREMIALGIDDLPEQYREAVWMRYMHHRSYAEIADALQVPMGTLKTWLFRARNHLQERFEDTELAAM
jgi:RNA polymerase sigma-70 factor (ECF subfamily)